MGGMPHLQDDAGRARALATIAAIELDWRGGIVSGTEAMAAVAAALERASATETDICRHCGRNIQAVKASTEF